MTADKFIEIIKNHGALGVLAIWVLSLQADVRDVQQKLYNCMGERQELSDRTTDKTQTNERAYFIFPEKKRRKDEFCISNDC